MRERLSQLLQVIIEEYIKTAQPVASQFLASKWPEPISSATMRNEMIELEKLGFLVSPHTSAGRIPTAKGYQYYVDNFLKVEKLSAKIKDVFDDLVSENISRENQKQLAKKISELVNEAVILAFSENDIYYTGLSMLFSQPEFADKNAVIDLSRVLDHFEGVINEVFESTNEPHVLIGENCPFGGQCSVVGSKIPAAADARLFILGPSRMDYQLNFNLIHFFSTLNNDH